MAFSARALGGFWSDEHTERVGHSHGPCMGLGGYLGLFWALAGIACARVLLVFLWLHQSMITPNCGISGGAQILFYFFFFFFFFFLCGHKGPPSGENAVGFSFKKKRYSFI